MVTETPNLLRVWWYNLNAYQKRELSIHLGHLPSIMNLGVWPKFIEVVTRFWDDERMVFRFGDVEMTPTVEEIRDCLDNVGMCHKRKNHPDHHILLPDKPTSTELKNMLLLVNADWLDTPSIPFLKFYERWGHENYYKNFPNEFLSRSSWSQTQTLAFAVCLLGTMVFPQGEGNEIDTRVVMVTHAIFEGVGKKGQVKKYFNLAPIILADIYRSLGQCKNGFPFFQGCNILLQWWMSKHLVKTYETQKQKLAEPQQESHLNHYEFHLSNHRFKIHSTREAWAKVFHDIKDGNVQWMFQGFMSEKIVIQGAKCPFLILPGIRGVRPYNPSRVMRQFGRRQVLPFKGDTSRYVFDYNGCDKIPYAKDICQEWAGRVNLKESMTENRYEAGYVDEYKKWLQDDLRGTLDPTPRTGRQIEDVQVRLQIQAYHFQQEWDRREQEFQRREQEFQHREYESQRALAFATQELADARACLIRMDLNLDYQLNTLQGVSMSSKAVFAEPHVITSKFLIREEVGKARGGAGPSAF
ncbi:hypothetical protein KY284_015164 [Solanum tuberosum]|nr:hypothetical protein KY284_015164 [Solanum tuberosum]